MRRSYLLWASALVLAAAAPVRAGKPGEKCTYSTQECLDLMAAKMKTGGFVGLELDVDEKTGSPVVRSIFPGTPAEQAGLQPGDVLHTLNGVVINEKNEEALMKARGEWKPGQQVTYTIKRNGLEQNVTLTLAPMPADVMAKMIGKHLLDHATAEIAKNDAQAAKD